MKNLARHIEFLLRDNDCVILPGFGGFIAHDVPAYYVSEEGLYYPPSRNISFNAAITMNDGLLAQSYMRSYQIDYARANYMIDIAVEQLTDTLDEEGCVTLPRIGKITQDVHQSLQFIPDASGIVSPIHFGLGAFIIKELAWLNKPIEAPGKAEGHNSHKTKVISLHINKEVLRRTISTAAVILLLLMVALPTGTHRPTDIASLHLTSLIAPPQAREASEPAPIVSESIVEGVDTTQAEATLFIAPAATTPIEETEIEVLATEPAATESITAVPTTTETAQAEVPIMETPQPIVPEAQPTKTYHIIVASLPNHRGADEELSRYASMGYPSATLVERDDRVRISLVQFTDKDEANTYLTSLRQNARFQNAWLLAVRN